MRQSVSFAILSLLFLFCMVSSSKASGQGFRAAVVKVDITPQNPEYLMGYGARKSTGVHDHIYHRIVALDDGKTQFFLISTEVVSISPAEYDRVTAKLYRQYNISPKQIWWTVTHTHSAPKVGHFQGIPFPHFIKRRREHQHKIDYSYTDMVERKLIKGILEARKKLTPARLGVGWGLSQANINRRAIDVDGNTSLGLNPDGAVDRRIGLLRIDKEDGTPLVLIANYPMHGTVLGHENLKISGDAPGIVAEYIEQKIGAPMLFINGAAGNLAPIYSVYPNPQAGHLEQFRVLLGDKILEANRKILFTTDEVTLNTGSVTVETPRKSGLGWSSDLSDYTRTTDAGINMIRLPVRFLKINDNVAIWSAPIELFCEIANNIRSRSPFAYTFYFGYSNGSLGYLPTKKAWKYGGYNYEVKQASPYTPAAGRDLTEAVLGYLQGEMRSEGDGH